MVSEEQYEQVTEGTSESTQTFPACDHAQGGGQRMQCSSECNAPLTEPINLPHAVQRDPPVQDGALERGARVVRALVHHERGGQVQRAQQHVHAVEAGGHEEGGAVGRVGDGEGCLVVLQVPAPRKVVEWVVGSGESQRAQHVRRSPLSTCRQSYR